MRIRSRLAPLIGTLGLLGLVAMARPIMAGNNCPLAVGKPYRTRTASTVFVVTEDCKKRPVFNPAVYFSHFATWGETAFVDPATLNAVPDHPLRFLPWGPLREFRSGSLVKTVDDPKVYLLIDGSAYPIASEAAFKALGYSFSQVEDVTPEVLGRAVKMTTEVRGVDDAPAGLLFKYPNDPNVYVVVWLNGLMMKSYVSTMEILESWGRGDRIAVFSTAKVLPDHAKASPKSDHTSPVVSIVSPAAGSTLTGTATISATATDKFGISSVHFSIDSTVLATDTAAPYEVTFDTAGYANGAHTLNAFATDNNGKTATSSITVTIANSTGGGGGGGGGGTTDTAAPTISFTAPAAGATVNGTVALSASASDNVGVASVRFSIGSTTIATDTTSPYSTSLDTTAYANGSYTLTALATDTSGNAASTTRSITISNAAPDTTAPTVSFTAPAAGATVSGTTTISATATDNVAVGSVRFSIDSTVIVTDTASPYSASLDTTAFANGSHALTALATDTSGNTATATRSITISNTTTPPPTAGNSSSAVGMNIAGLADWSQMEPFVDAFVMAREFVTSSFGDASSVITARDANGWPTATNAEIQTIMFTELPYDHTGTYVMKWDGNAHTMNLGLSARNVRCDNGSTDLANCPTKRALFEVEDGGPVALRLPSLHSTDPIKNIRIIQPGGVCGTSPTALTFTEGCASSRGGVGSCSAGKTCYDFETVGYDRFTDPTSAMSTKAVFHPAFLKSLEGFRAFRFMDMMQTNNSPVTDWASRANLKYPTYTSPKGAPVEMLVALANRMSADAWFTLPHRATNDFATQFATYVRDNLATNLKVYVEYSNETWNSIFGQASYVVQQGRAQNLSDNDFAAGRYYTANRTAELGNIFKTVFGAGSSRVVTTYGGWAANSWWSGEVLRFLTAGGQTAKQRGIDAIAIAPYFGGYIGDASCQSRVQTMTVDEVFTEITNGGILNSVCGAPANGALAESRGWMTANATEIGAHDLEMIAYEGGQHLVGTGGVENNQTVTNLFIAVNRDSRIKSVLTTYLTDWKNAGGHLFAYFSHISGPSKWGSWGAMEHMFKTRAESPKLDAVMSFNEQNACWWSGCAR